MRQLENILTIIKPNANNGSQKKVVIAFTLKNFGPDKEPQIVNVFIENFYKKFNCKKHFTAVARERC